MGRPSYIVLARKQKYLQVILAHLIRLVVVLLVVLCEVLLLRVVPSSDNVVEVDLLAPLFGVDEPRLGQF